MTLTVGQSLQDGKYTLEKVLGKGRFTITYRATDEAGNYVAIKTLNDSLLHELTQTEIDELKSKFRTQGLKLAQCNNRHIVRVKEILKEGQVQCVVMEYVDGMNLAEKQLPQKLALSYIQQIGEALIQVHDRHLLHLNIKPENIILRSGLPQAVLIDFGLAQAFDHPSIAMRSREEGFSAPEMYSETQEKGTYTDVYSLAATLYELLTGQVPVSAIARQDSQARLIPPKEIARQIGDRVERAILKGMALDRSDRPQTVREWLTLLGVKRTIVVPKWNAMEWTIVAIAGMILLTALVGLMTYIKPKTSPPQSIPESEAIERDSGRRAVGLATEIAPYRGARIRAGQAFILNRLRSPKLAFKKYRLKKITHSGESPGGSAIAFVKLKL